MSDLPGFAVINRKSLETREILDFKKAKNLPKNFFPILNLPHSMYDKGDFFGSLAGFQVHLPFSETLGPVSEPILQSRYFIYKIANHTRFGQDYDWQLSPPAGQEFLDLFEFHEIEVELDESSSVRRKNSPRSKIRYHHMDIITDDYYVMVFTSYVLDIACAPITILKFKDAPFHCMKLDEQLPGYILVLDKISLKVISRFETDFTLVEFHAMNGFQEPEDKNLIYLDFAVYTENLSDDMVKVYFLEYLRKEGEDLEKFYNEAQSPCIPFRMALDLSRSSGDSNKINTVKVEKLFKLTNDSINFPAYEKMGTEMPKIQDSLLGRPYDTFTSIGYGTIIADRIYKSTISTQKRYVWLEPGYLVNEAIMLENQFKNETVILCLVLPVKQEGGTSSTGPPFLVFLDGSAGNELHELGRAWFEEDIGLNFGLHTLFIPDEIVEDDKSSSSLRNSFNLSSGIVFSIFILINRNLNSF